MLLQVPFIKGCWAAGNRLGISLTSALHAPSQGACHWPGRAAETVSSLGVRMALSPAPAGDSILQLHLFSRQKQMFASALRRKSSWEVVPSQAVCNLGSLTALQKQLSDCITVTVGWNESSNVVFYASRLLLEQIKGGNVSSDNALN